MTFEQIVITVGVSLIAIVVPLCILLWIRDYKKNKHKCVRPTDEELFDIEPETVTLHAEVVDMCCRSTVVGIRTPKAIREFLVVFRDDEGELHSIPVSEDIYEGFDVGQVGMLTLVGGSVDSYVLD